MKKINKITSITLIFTLIAVFLCSGIIYAEADVCALRPALQFNPMMKELQNFIENNKKTPWSMFLEVNDEDSEYVNKLVKTVTEPEGHRVGEQIRLQTHVVRRWASSLTMPIDADKIVIHTIDMPLLGLPRFEGAIKARDLVYAYTRLEPDGKMHMYVTRLFWDKYLLPWSQSNILAELLDYGWARRVNNLSEIESAKRSWAFFEYSSGQYLNEAGLSPFQYFILSRYESEEDVEGLQALDFYNKADLDGRFQKYVKRLIAMLENIPSMAAENRASADKRLAMPWDKDKCRALSHWIVKELELESSGKFPAIDLELKFGSKPYVRERWARIFSMPKLRQSPERTPIGPGRLRNDYHGSSFIRVGYLFFLSESDYLGLSEPLKIALGGNVILIKELYDSTIDHIGLGRYTMTTIVAMLNSDLSGKRVMDFGAADGILSLVALKLGASSVILIDIDGKELNKAKANLKLNGFKYNDDYHTIVADLKDKKKIAQALRGLPLSQDEIAIVSNIGSSEHWYYGTTNLASAYLIPVVEKELYSKVAAFIAGGVLDEETNARALIKERSFLKQLGFEINPRIASYGFFKSNGAWIADRKNKLSKQKEVMRSAKAHQNNI